MILVWWNALMRWFQSEEGWLITTTVILPFVAILCAGIIAALIARGASSRLLKRQDNAAKAAAIAGLIAMVRRATVWSSLSSAEKDHLDHQMAESVVRLRLLPIDGADLAAEWTGHRIASIKRHSAALIAEAESEVETLENGLIEWHRHPSRAKKQFRVEIAYLRSDADAVDRRILADQKQWEATRPAPADPPTATLDAEDLDKVLAGIGRTDH